MGLILPGMLVDIAGPRSQTQEAQDSWSTTRAIGPWPKWSRTAFQTRGLSNPGPSHPGEVVDMGGPHTRS